MGGTKITITGADEAHYLSASKESSRLFHFPDGISRLITLSSWHWEVLHRLYKKWSKRELLKMVYEHALEGETYPDDFEQQIQVSFRLLLKCSMADVMTEKDWSIANQRFSVNTDDL